MSGLKYNQRLFVAGMTRSGKSEILNWAADQIACQKLLLDTKGGEWVIPGVEPTRDPLEIDWTQPWVHYVTQGTELGEINEVFRQCNERRNLLVLVHELGDVCGYNTNATPPQADKYIAQGGAWGKGWYGASQLPVDMPKRAKNQAEHVVVVVPAMDDDQLKVVARLIEGYSLAQLKELILEVQEEKGPHAWIHFEKGATEGPTVYDPLPEEVRAGITVRRAEGVS